MILRKKLIEVALPLEAINAASVVEKQPFTRRHPRSIHIWWSRKPLATARAVIFSQMVDDPSSCPEEFPTMEAQEKERQRLFRLMEELVLWENTTSEDVLDRARDEIWKSWRRGCTDNRDHPRAKELFNPDKLPAFHDPFAGAGSLSLEAQRLGLESHASELNPVAVLICKAMIEIPPKFAGTSPVNPETRSQPRLMAQSWRGAQGLAEDLQYYGKWMRDEAEKRIGHLYPKVEITSQMAQGRPDLQPLLGQKLTVIAWLWVRTVRSPNPAFAAVHVPLAPKFWLSSAPGREAYIEPIISDEGYRLVVRTGKPVDVARTNRGTKSGDSGSAFLCLLSGVPIPFHYVRAEAKAGRMESRLMAIVADSDRGKVYLSPDGHSDALATNLEAVDPPQTDLPAKALGFRVQEYGMTRWRDLYSPRQLVALATLSDLVSETRQRVQQDAHAVALPGDSCDRHSGGADIQAYADAVAVYLALAVSRWADLSNSLCSWNNRNQNVRALFARQAIPMNWDFAELSPFSPVGSWYSIVEASVAASVSFSASNRGSATQADATTQSLSVDKVVSTDPPYYDNIGYADLSDFFYVWLRRSLRQILPDLFSTLAVPKAEELVATPYRHGNREKAEAFFLQGMTRAITRVGEQSHPAYPVTLYYAFKQAETDGGDTTSTGWETFLGAVLDSGLSVTGTWPIRTERSDRSVAMGNNALASSIVLVCRQRNVIASTIGRGEFLGRLRAELPHALRDLQWGNIAPVDLAQAAIGPGMAVYTRYSKVLDAAGNPVTVRDALKLINRVLDEILAEQEGEYDSDTRWALSWYEQQGFSEGEYGVAEILSKAKDTSVAGMVDAGILAAKGGRVRLLRPAELPPDWDPATDKRLTVWEMLHHLIRAQESGGDDGAALLMAKLGSRAENARDLAYRLYIIAERKKGSTEALWYNSLVQSWPDIVSLATGVNKPRDSQSTFIGGSEAEVDSE